MFCLLVFGVWCLVSDVLVFLVFWRVGVFVVWCVGLCFLGVWSVVGGLWSFVVGLWSLVPGLWSLVFCLWSLVFGLLRFGILVFLVFRCSCLVFGY